MSNPLYEDRTGQRPAPPSSGSSLPNGQAHDKPLLEVGTYQHAGQDIDVASIVHSDNDGQADQAATGPVSPDVPPYMA